MAAGRVAGVSIALQHRRACAAQTTKELQATPLRPHSAPSNSTCDLSRRALREDPSRYLWRFGFGREGCEPALAIAVNGHEEESGHTMYILKCSLTNTDSVLKPDGNGASCQGPIAWTCRRRLRELRDELHDVVKEQMVTAYSSYFNKVGFAHMGGPPGTTARLSGWLCTLSRHSVTLTQGWMLRKTP